MEALKVIGHEKIGKIEFTGIEGGFGEGKKAILAKDAALIHTQPVGNINRIVNNNRKWFEDGIDVIDLKDNKNFAMLLKQSGFSQNQINASDHIYLFSERGYSMLVKFMSDEKATQIYKQLLNNYFNMRVAIKENKPAIVNQERLKIMKDNSATRKANMLYKIAMATESNTSKENLLAKAAEVLTGEMTIPVMKQKEYSAKDIAEALNTTANMVGRIANKLGLKAKQPGHNKYGRWANSKSKYSDKEVPQWLYTNEGMKAVKKELEK
ncbi:ORF6N domain-containing protein [Lactobacillus taiwanensis]|uniref:KilA-N DNA-binding domain-containing protein n=1 Tax=Lactobacillus taiwanensis TaxID=508451 RepID=A0A256LCE4_9LACO|nr:ORF6N domain-containing protein [Lactobacillus taiwanensis]OYR87496.1 hypothetical protein CBF53_08645 [Lactobacillus taiwanensis]OYR91114.1 hypothetical protein CBF70_08080 [Lactobacillus taiwanensis]OYR91787.1 hypothetical protein CBF59_05300 [Lactobacillus taiwanensis]OYR94523.1 hypothetical protein CBF58_08855 [Lactobacillus taiwanensis]